MEVLRILALLEEYQPETVYQLEDDDGACAVVDQYSGVFQGGGFQVVTEEI